MQHPDPLAGILELRREVEHLRRTNTSEMPAATRTKARPRPTGRAPKRATRQRRERLLRARRRRWIAGASLIVAVLFAAMSLSSPAGTSAAHPLPSASSLAGMTLRERIVAIARSQVGYRTTPANSYCNKFSAYWGAGASTCPDGARSEEWCADFAAWAWRKAGVPVSYGYGPGQLNAGAVSFYAWAVAHGTWHPADADYIAAPGDVAVYGLSLGTVPTATHVAIVTSGAPGGSGPDAINGDGDHTGFSVVESASHEARADAGHAAALAGYVSP